MSLTESPEPFNAGTPVAAPSTGDCLLTLPEVLHHLRTSKSGLYGLIRANDFSPPIKRGRASRWLLSDINAHIVKLSATRTRAAA